MKKIREIVGQRKCPRCKFNQVVVCIEAFELKRGGLRDTYEIMERDSDPACEWPGLKVPMLPSDAEKMIYNAKNRLEVSGNFADKSQPPEK